MTARELLESDHRELDGLFDKVFAAVDSGNCDATFKTLDLFWARLAMHIRAEHLCVFPAIREAADVSGTEIPALLDRLRHDHDFFMTELSRAIKALRLTYNFGNEPETIEIVRTIISAVRDRLIEHNLIEEAIVYQCADQAAGQAALATAVKKELDNYPARFVRSSK